MGFSIKIEKRVTPKLLIRNVLMDSVQGIVFLTVFVVLYVNTFTVQAQSDASAKADQMPAPSNAYECTQVSIDDLDPSLLTKEERIALLDGSLDKSIDSYSTCIASVQQEMSNNSGSAGGSNGSNNQQTGDSGASGISDNGAAKKEPLPAQTNLPNSKQITPAERGVIAPKDNEKIICKLLFEEIQSVTDSDMLKGLKEQYRNYNCGK